MARRPRETVRCMSAWAWCREGIATVAVCGCRGFPLKSSRCRCSCCFCWWCSSNPIKCIITNTPRERERCIHRWQDRRIWMDSGSSRADRRCRWIVLNVGFASWRCRVCLWRCLYSSSVCTLMRVVGLLRGGSWPTISSRRRRVAVLCILLFGVPVYAAFFCVSRMIAAVTRRGRCSYRIPRRTLSSSSE